MVDPTPIYSEDERNILRQARIFRELLDHPAWKEYAELLGRQMELRRGIIFTPLNAMPDDLKSLDFTSRAAMLEMLKGAVLGLMLARDTPQSIIDHAKRIVEDHAQTHGAS